MWSSVTLSARPTWDLISYSVTAVWLEDPDAEPVVLTRSGTCRLTDSWLPLDVLEAVTRDLATLRLPKQPD